MNKHSKKLFLSGNEAVALGAYEAGCSVGTGYPGTPSTEIIENFKNYKGVYAEWSVNEKVALEIAIGSSFSGARTIVTMKHVGLNVAADPLFTLSYTGVKGGLVIAVADDPGMHSSQNEQDSRHYARAAKMPVLEPSDSAEARDFTKLAFEISEKYGTPVILRMTTRTSHAKSIVESGSALSPEKPEGFLRDIPRYVMIPAFARKRRVALEERLSLISAYSAETGINKTEMRDEATGIITSGAVYNYVREALPSASILKLAVSWPFPDKKIREFAGAVKKLYVVEELDPFIEDQVKALGINVTGKEIIPSVGELSPDIIRKAFSLKLSPGLKAVTDIPPRPPSLCPGCPHRAVFEILRDMKITVAGDIGCYSLGAIPPYSSMDTLIDMGSGIGLAQGMEIVSPGDERVAVIGDSTFAHSGVSSLMSASYNGRGTVVIVLDNGTTAMTGMQPNPFSGSRITGAETAVLDYGFLAKAVGIGDDNFAVVDAYKPEEIKGFIKKMLSSRKLSLLVVKGLCVVLKRKVSKNGKN
ncbi:MAG: thiamine pyrophosphate-dependent enzyme [Elusimicrobiota bacterium]|nr:thiamine pyrophosphate-dependent enzyme [Elusimicrobiota bacterium]